jgi:hypothetical protein
MLHDGLKSRKSTTTTTTNLALALAALGLFDGRADATSHLTPHKLPAGEYPPPSLSLQAQTQTHHAAGAIFCSGPLAATAACTRHAETRGVNERGRAPTPAGLSYRCESSPQRRAQSTHTHTHARARARAQAQASNLPRAGAA